MAKASTKSSNTSDRFGENALIRGSVLINTVLLTPVMWTALYRMAHRAGDTSESDA